MMVYLRLQDGTYLAKEGMVLLKGGQSRRMPLSKGDN